MKKIILIPDSFKGTMSSAEICSIMANSIKKFEPHCQIISVPVADGGEGSVEAFLTAVGGAKIAVTVNNPFMEKMESFYGILDESKTSKKTAVIEMASCAGLPLAENRLNPCITTTYGVGELMLHAAKQGCKRIILGLGGSCTNDAGCGAAAAAGALFFDEQQNTFIPTGGTLSKIAHINVHALQNNFAGIEIIAMCDIDNPLYGKSGAAHVFAPQKGASDDMVCLLDNQLQSISKVIQTNLNTDISELAGAGAAGGMGGGVAAFFGATLQMGIETVLDTVNFDSLIKDADMVFSGEGKIDTQSLHGKVVIGIARRTKKEGIPLIAFVGDIGDNIEKAYEDGVSAILSINRVAVEYKQARLRAKNDLALTVETFMRLRKL